MRQIHNIIKAALLFNILFSFTEIPRYREEIKVERSPGPYDFHPGFRYGCGNQPLQPMHGKFTHIFLNYILLPSFIIDIIN